MKPQPPNLTKPDTPIAENSYTRADMDQLTGAAMIEFGASWCEYCQAAQPDIAAALARYPDIRHIRIEDGKGQRLGRSYAVKLWPTLIFIKNGNEIERLVRPQGSEAIAEALAKIHAD